MFPVYEFMEEEGSHDIAAGSRGMATGSHDMAAGSCDVAAGSRDMAAGSRDMETGPATGSCNIEGEGKDHEPVAGWVYLGGVAVCSQSPHESLQQGDEV